MRAIDLAVKDLSQIFRDWKAALFLVIMPIGFTLLLGFVFSGVDGQEDPRLPIGFVDQDGGGSLSTHLLDLLEASDAIRPEVLDVNRDEVARRVGDQDLAAAIIVPAGYGEGILAGENATAARLIVIVDRESTAGQTAENGIQSAVARLTGAATAARLTARAFEAQGGTADQAFLQETLARAVEAWDNPPLTVKLSQTGTKTGDEEQVAGESNNFAHSSAGIMVQFAMAGLIGAAEILVLERKTGALRRLLTTPISRFEIIVGHYLAMVLMVLLQLVILVAFGQLALDVDYMGAPLATAIMVLVTALWAASLGLLIGTFAKTEEQSLIFAMLTMLILSGLGGAWMPLEVTGQAFQTVARFTPATWAIEGFENIVLRGQGLGSVWLPAFVLMGFTIVFFAIATWRFKFE